MRSVSLILTFAFLVLLAVAPGIIRASSQDSNVSKDIPSSKSAKLLVDDAIQDLKSNDTKNA
jgi:hypothetical protein